MESLPAIRIEAKASVRGHSILPYVLTHSALTEIWVCQRREYIEQYCVLNV